MFGPEPASRLTLFWEGRVDNKFGTLFPRAKAVPPKHASHHRVRPFASSVELIIAVRLRVAIGKTGRALVTLSRNAE